MIFGNIKNLKEFEFLQEDVLKCLEYTKAHDLLNIRRLMICLTLKKEAMRSMGIDCL